MAYSVIDPDVVIVPILLPEDSVNQRFPSGPAAMPSGWLPDVVMAYSVIDPDVVIFQILLPASSVNQRFPSGPSVISYG